MAMYRTAIDSNGVISPFHGGEHEFAELPRLNDWVSVSGKGENGRDWFQVVAVLHELQSDPGGPLIIVQKSQGNPPMSWGMPNI